jgi:hypothetical protein
VAGVTLALVGVLILTGRLEATAYWLLEKTPREPSPRWSYYSPANTLDSPRACCRIRVGVILHHYIDAIQRGNHYILIFADKIFDCETGSQALYFLRGVCQAYSWATSNSLIYYNPNKLQLKQPFRQEMHGLDSRFASLLVHIALDVGQTRAMVSPTSSIVSQA